MSQACRGIALRQHVNVVHDLREEERVQMEASPWWYEQGGKDKRWQQQSMNPRRNL